MSSIQEVKRDALGSDIIIGNLYGYANNRDGFNSVWIGRAQKITKKGVTLKVLQHKSGVYGDLKLAEDSSFHKVATSVNVKSVMLFPVSESYFN